MSQIRPSFEQIVKINSLASSKTLFKVKQPIAKNMTSLGFRLIIGHGKKSHIGANFVDVIMLCQFDIVRNVYYVNVET